MKRSVGAALLAAVVLTLSVQAQASEVRGSVEVRLDAGELPVTNGAVSLYLVGIPGEEGYRVLDRFGGGVIRREDAGSEHLALYLSELAGGGRELLLDVDGRVKFSGLEEGLYLVKQTEKMDGFYPFRAFLVSVPAAGNWDLVESPTVLPITMEPPRTGDGLRFPLAVMTMVVSGMGLIFCWMEGKRRKQRHKK